MMFQFFCFFNPQTVLDEHVVVMMPWKSLWLFDMNFWQVLASSYIPRKKSRKEFINETVEQWKF